MAYRASTLFPVGLDFGLTYDNDLDGDSWQIRDIDLTNNSTAGSVDFGTSSQRVTKWLFPNADTSGLSVAASSYAPGWYVRPFDLAPSGNPASGEGDASFILTSGTYTFVIGYASENADAVGAPWSLTAVLRVGPGDDLRSASHQTLASASPGTFIPTGIQDNDIATFSMFMSSTYIIPAGWTVGVAIIVNGQGTAVVGNSISFSHGRAGVTAPFNCSLTLPAPFKYRFIRAPQETPPAPAEAAARVYAGARRTAESETPPGESALRVFSGSRFTGDDVDPVAETAIRSAAHPRQTFDASGPFTDEAERVASFNRIGAEVVDPTVDTAIRLTSATRFSVETLDPTAETAFRLVTYGREVRYAFQPGDAPLVDPIKAITGVVRDSTGAPYLGEASVILVRADSDIGVQTTTSSPTTGGYTFPRNSYDTAAYYVVAFVEDPEEESLQAVTERNLIPE
jgi:hypothetical protein